MLLPTQTDILGKFIFFTGCYNGFLSLFLLYPTLYRAFGLNVSQPVWGWVLSAFLAFTAAVLIIASRDLRGKASIVYWEAMLRFAAAAILIPAGLLGDLGVIAAVLGAGDALIGCVYVFGLAKTLQATHRQLLFDRL